MHPTGLTKLSEFDNKDFSFEIGDPLHEDWVEMARCLTLSEDSVWLAEFVVVAQGLQRLLHKVFLHHFFGKEESDLLSLRWGRLLWQLRQLLLDCLTELQEGGL